jgi:SH3-like domain-containing protein
VHRFACFLAGFLLLAGTAHAAGEVAQLGASGLALPRFVSLAATEVNLRTGPGTRYPKAWVFHRRGLPMLLTAEHEHWRKVRDVDGAEGWVHQSLLSGRRRGLVVGAVRTLRAAPDPQAPALLQAEPGVMGPLLACRGDWCEMEIAGRRGWVQRDGIFGALPGESFE